MLLSNKPGLLLEIRSLYPWGKGREGSMAWIQGTFPFLGASSDSSVVGKLSNNPTSSCFGRVDNTLVPSVLAGQESVSCPSRLSPPRY